MIPWNCWIAPPYPKRAASYRSAQRGEEFSIRITGRGELMNSRVHGSEDALTLLTCARSSSANSRGSDQRARYGLYPGGPRCELGPDAEVVVAELVPAVVAWVSRRTRRAGRQPVAGRARDGARNRRRPRAARRAQRIRCDIAGCRQRTRGLTRDANDWLHEQRRARGGIRRPARRRPARGMVCWRGRDFTDRLRRAGFGRGDTRAGAKIEGARHIVWLARRGGASR